MKYRIDASSIVARATDNSGVAQEGVGDTLLGGTFPDGTSRMHAVKAIVKRAWFLQKRQRLGAPREEEPT